MDLLRIAHRGADAAEKYTEADLRTVAAHGANMVEFDVNVTADGRLIARHDGPFGALSSLRRSVDLKLRVSRTFRQQSSPSVESVIRSARATGLMLYVDIKTLTPTGAADLVAMLREYEMSELVILASSQPEILTLCQRVAPKIPRSILFRSIREDPISISARARAQFVHPCWELHRSPHRFLEGSWLQSVRSHGLGVITWHEERESVLRALCRLGVDGICTDDPELLTKIARLRWKHTASEAFPT